MGDRGEDMQRKDPGRVRTQVTAIRNEPIWYEFYPVSYQGTTRGQFLEVTLFHTHPK